MTLGAAADTSTSTGSDTATGQDVTTGQDATTGQEVTQAVLEGTATEQQTIMNTGYDYRIPSIENLARNDRAQISLIDEQFAQFMAGQNLPYLNQVLSNELAIIDLRVRRLQVAYLSTILMSPISGIITGVFTGLGDPVSAGGVLVRVEDNQTVLLEGTLVYRGMIAVGDTATIQTTRFSDPAAVVTITGTVVAAQGHEASDDWWNVAISCDNIDGNGNPLFPLHYSFDHDDTTMEIS